jgi:hypothetical protein
MRDNGVSEFPDPESGGALILPDGVDSESAAFKKAEEACKKFQGAGGQQGPGAGGGWSTDDQVKYAQCMRDNGLKKFPDPDPEEGGSMLGEETGIDPNSDQFKKADKACAQHKPQEMQNMPPPQEGIGEDGQNGEDGS